MTVLNRSPAGPTLFYLPASFGFKQLNFDYTPQYLFRIFDKDSSGRNDGTVITSKASITGSQESGRTDLLTLEEQKATELLHVHLNKPCFSGEESGNLKPWASSLLFAIQYTVWRGRVGNRPLFNIQICVVDTTNFPRGQFVQHLWLINSYYTTAKQLGNSAQGFFDSRPEKEDFYNGEYLSQRVVNHKGRSPSDKNSFTLYACATAF
ncbi:hypothetical protein P154DRAFT_521178 [Amniculicola lignicola CBS 123094]|uniref:Uncharacterized protein n=1 Tax=Amniculicola lignicola CBS 123094 TaxID=1392246 RepID=A0A6A5WKK0_9PLEO|nr:hypothetical protein P154DRAFT_521178 [Amniculicola lignicola CBS 123094]